MNEKTAWAILTQNRETYNAVSQAFSQTRNYLWPVLLKAKSYLKNGMKVLDIGCGNGRVAEVFSEKNIFYKGIDFSPVILSEAKNLVNESERRVFEIGDILHLEEEAEFYDMILCIAVLNHIPTKKLQLQALENVFQVLKPGGVLFMTNWNLWNPHEKKSVWASKKIGGFRECLTYWNGNPLYYHAFTKRELEKMLKKIGFEIIVLEYQDDKKRTTWYHGKNILTVARKKI